MAEVKGRRELKEAFKRAAKSYPRAVSAAMQDEAMALMAKVKVPHKSGHLQSTAFVSGASEGGRGSVIRAGFRAAYAKVVNARTRFFTSKVLGFKRGLFARIVAGAHANLDRAPAGEQSGVPTQTASRRRRRRSTTE